MMFQESLAELRFNDPARVSVGKLQKHLHEIIKQVHDKKQRRLITKSGEVVAILCPMEEVARLDYFDHNLKHSGQFVNADKEVCDEY